MARRDAIPRWKIFLVAAGIVLFWLGVHERNAREEERRREREREERRDRDREAAHEARVRGAAKPK